MEFSNINLSYPPTLARPELADTVDAYFKGVEDFPTTPCGSCNSKMSHRGYTETRTLHRVSAALICGECNARHVIKETQKT